MGRVQGGRISKIALPGFFFNLISPIFAKATIRIFMLFTPSFALLVDPEPISQEVAKWPGVLLTYVEPLPHVPPVVKPSDDPRSGNQGYLTAAPEGIDALWAWSLTDGTDIDFVDVEQGWILNHEDLIGAGITIISGLSLGLLLIGLAGLNGMLTVDRVGSVRKLLSRSA